METKSLSQLVKIITDTPDYNSTVTEAYHELWNRFIEKFEHRYYSFCWNKYTLHKNSSRVQDIYHDIIVELHDDLRTKRFNAGKYSNDVLLLKGLLYWIGTKAENIFSNQFRREKKIVNASKIEARQEGKESEGHRDNVEEGWAGSELTPFESLCHKEEEQKVNALISRIKNKKYKAIISAHYTHGKKLPQEVKQKLMEEHRIKTERDYNAARYRAGIDLKEILDSLRRKC